MLKSIHRLNRLNRLMIMALILMLVFSGNSVFAGVITTQQGNQGSEFDPQLEDFNTVITLDASLPASDPSNNVYVTYNEALTKAKNASTPKPVLINVHPGNYTSVANAANIENLVIRGITDNPKDVVFTATNGTSVVEIGSTAGFSNYIIENVTLKLTYNTSGNPKQTTGIQMGNLGLNHEITFRNLIIDASSSSLSGLNVNGIYLYNGENITIDNVDFNTVTPDTTRGVILASTSNSEVKKISGNCTIPVSALDYYDASSTYTAQFPSNNYVENSEFLISVSKGGRYSYIMAPTYEKAFEYTTHQLKQNGTDVRSIVDLSKNQLIVDDRLTSFSKMEDYLTGTDSSNNKALVRERSSEEYWTETSNVALINPSGDYVVNIDGLTITAYDEKYSADSFVPISTATFSGKAVTLDNFDFSGLADPTVEGMIQAGIISPGSSVESGEAGGGPGNIIWARMTFDSNGGTLGQSYLIKPCGIYYGNDTELPQPARKGYKFKGWRAYTNNDITDQIVLGSEGVTVFAEWEKIPEANADGGTGNKTVVDDELDTTKQISDNTTVHDSDDSASDLLPDVSPDTADIIDYTAYLAILILSSLCLTVLLSRRMKDTREKLQ